MLFFMTVDDLAQKAADQKTQRLEANILSLAQGEISPLSELYTLAKTSVYGFALSIVKSHPWAEDVTQDTFLQVHRSAASYTPKGKPMAWILTIAKNLALMKLREAGTMQPTDFGEWQMAEQDFSHTSDERITLRLALTILSDEERQIVTLHAVSGLKHREISDLLGLKLSTVLNKYNRALSKLKKHLKEEAE